MLKKLTDVNDLFLATYHVAPYRGCAFKCAYCDGMSQSGPSMDDPAFPGFLERLETELPEIDSRAVVGFTLGEPYQAAEKSYRLTREALRLLGKHRQPALVLTKSPAILEDIELLEWVNTRTLAIVTATVITLNKTLHNPLERGVPLPEARIDMIEKLRHSGIPCGFALNPIMPFLTDGREELFNLLDTLAGVKPDFIVWDYLWIPSDAHRQQIRALLQRIDETLISKYNTLYQGNVQPDSEYRASMDQFLIRSCQSLGIDPRIPPKLYQDYLAPEKVMELKKRRDAFLSSAGN